MDFLCGGNEGVCVLGGGEVVGLSVLLLDGDPLVTCGEDGTVDGPDVTQVVLAYEAHVCVAVLSLVHEVEVFEVSLVDGGHCISFQEL